MRSTYSRVAALLLFPIASAAGVTACGDDDATPSTDAGTDAPSGDTSRPPVDSGGGVDAGNSSPDADADAGLVLPEAAEDLKRDILATDLDFDVAARKAIAKITIAGSAKPGFSLETGDLSIESVKLGETDLKFKVTDTTAAPVDGGPTPRKQSRLDIGVPIGTSSVEVTIAYEFQDHKGASASEYGFDGWNSREKLTFTWPYYCSNLFPCHSDPADGTTFKLNVKGVPAGETAIFPPTIAIDAPSYQVAFAIGNFTYQAVGTTAKGTEVGYYKTPGTPPGVVSATSKLKDLVQFYEDTYGAYKFGPKVASVNAFWADGADYGGMEHHPFWHVSQGAMANEEVHAHEAAHGWFGDGIRVKCWEDFVLSEGTVSYLAARAITVVRGQTAGDAIWAAYKDRLERSIARRDFVVWPQTCGQVDVLDLYTTLPYMKGAFFFKKVAEAIPGGPAKLDQILAKFYTANVGKAASMGDLIALIKSEGAPFDPAPLVDAWLKKTGNPGT